MRKSVKPVAVWPSYGAAYPPRARSHPDSVNLRSPYKRHFFLNQSCRSHQPRHGQHSAIFSSRISPLRKFDQLLKIGNGTRQFSASTPKRNDDFDDFEEEDEDDFTSSSSEMSRMVRQRGKIAEGKARQKREQEQALKRRGEELQTRAKRHANELQNASALLLNIKQILESIRRYAEEKRRAHERWMRRYEQVITRSASSVNVGSQSFEEYFLIKYPEFGVIEPYVNDNAIFIQHCKAEVSNCRQALRRIDLEMQLARFAASLGLITESLSDNHVTPIASAKRNIEEMIQPLHSFQFHYKKTQEWGLKLDLEKHKISSLLAKIAAENPKHKIRLYKFQHLIWKGSLELKAILHNLRRMKRLSRWRDPRGGSYIFDLIQNPSVPNTIRMLAASMEINSERLVSELNTHGISALLAHWYLHRWKKAAPRSVDLDIAWSHLDIYHPFYMYYVSVRRVNAEVIRHTDILHRTGDSKFRDYLKEWRYRLVVMRSNLLQDIEEMSYYTWIRLETEGKVSRLGGLPDTIAKGLFTPKDPLSSDLRRFFLHIDEFGDRLTQCINLDDTINQFAKQESATESEMCEFMDYSPSSKLRPIEGFRSATPKSATRIITLRCSNEQKPPARRKESYISKALMRALTNKHRARMRGAETTDVKFGAFTTPPRRNYCTDSRACMNDNEQQCGVSEAELALINKDRIVQLENNDAAISLVSDAEPPGIMSSRVPLDNSDRPPIVATDDTKPRFWSYNQYKTPDGQRIGIHYCKNLEHAERAAALFSDSKVLGFDIEWKPQAQASAGIKSNVSLIQIANEERIALFHIALFKGNEIHDLVPPSLKQVLESTDTVKVGVSIKADCSRVRRHLDIDTRGQFELSHLYKLVKYGSTQPKLVNKRAVSLAQQVEELLGQPLKKDDDVRMSDWTKPLDYEQVQYAASDAYASICLHRTLEAKRKALNPVPPLPAFAELNQPIFLAEDDKVGIEDGVAELSVRVKGSLEAMETEEEDVVEVNDETKGLDPA